MYLVLGGKSVKNVCVVCVLECYLVHAQLNRSKALYIFVVSIAGVSNFLCNKSYLCIIQEKDTPQKYYSFGKVEIH